MTDHLESPQADGEVQEAEHEIPFADCPDVTYGMANAASEVFEDVLYKMGLRIGFSSLVPFYYVAQAVIDYNRLLAISEGAEE